MNRTPLHQPPPGPIVAELMQAGLSLTTAMAMEQWKAREVLELLRGAARHEQRSVAADRGHGTI